MRSESPRKKKEQTEKKKKRGEVESNKYEKRKGSLKGRSQNQKKGRNEPNLPSGEVIKVDKWNKTDSSGGGHKYRNEDLRRVMREKSALISRLFGIFSFYS